jgi:hypothetical protein
LKKAGDAAASRPPADAPAEQPLIIDPNLFQDGKALDGAVQGLQLTPSPLQ